MKELSQYKEEIFRRSEQKIRQRKARRRIALGISIPLCLCLVVSGTVFGIQLTNFRADCKAESAPDMELPMEGVPLDSYTIEDPALLQEILNAPEKEDSKIENGSLVDGANDAVLDNAAPETRILQAGQEVYWLTGRTLYCESTGETRVLTEEQLRQLEALLEQEVNNE